LQPLRAGAGGFGDLVDAENRPLDAALRERRRQIVLDTLAETRPDLLLIETYPFGRRALRFELEPLIDAARALRPRPVLACSIRDIVVAKPDPARRQAIVATVRQNFQLLLVHADPRFIRLEASFPEAPSLADLLRYTGFVAAPAPPPETDTPSGEIVVSAGGGAAGAALLKAAKAARALSRFVGQPWRIITGRNLPEADFAALARDPMPDLVVERHRGDFPALLARSRLSVSQAGYNTVLDLLQARVPSLLVPFAEGGETEQPLRAERLRTLGLAEVMPEAALTPDSLAAAIDRAPPPVEVGFALDGAAQSAALLLAALSGALPRHAAHSPDPCQTPDQPAE
jgi:predicted glycosyltransferase